MPVTIKSDKKWKNILSGYELPEKVWKDFDYMTYEEFRDGSFARYRGQYYDISEFQRIPRTGGESHESYKAFKPWDGYKSDSYFSGIVIKLSSDGERYKIGMYYS